jgi:hypothetical protein
MSYWPFSQSRKAGVKEEEGKLKKVAHSAPGAPGQ